MKDAVLSKLVNRIDQRDYDKVMMQAPRYCWPKMMIVPICQWHISCSNDFHNFNGPFENLMGPIAKLMGRFGLSL